MAEPIHSTQYWRDRLHKTVSSNEPLHTSIFKCDTQTWKLIEEKHRDILMGLISKHDSILDCGCGYGRLLSLLPRNWIGPYLGIDISPDFIKLAKERTKSDPRLFEIASLEDLSHITQDQYDWAILISIRPMVKRNLGEERWAAMEKQIRLHAKKLLYLEYDYTDEGSIE